jgi:hypothetical protein
MMEPDAFRAQQEFWIDNLNLLDQQAEVIAEELAGATESFPNLVSAFSLTAAYVGHLHEYLRATGKDVALPEFPAGFCARNALFCDCVGGSQAACRVFDSRTEPVPPPNDECQRLWEQYVSALGKEREELLKVKRSQPRFWDLENRQPHFEAQKESDRLRRLLKERGCLIPVAAF